MTPARLAEIRARHAVGYAAGINCTHEMQGHITDLIAHIDHLERERAETIEAKDD